MIVFRGGTTGDFRAWDKFDVDAALDKVDAVNVETEEHRARKLQEHIGNEEKDKGNVQFKAGKYVAAIECYSRGMVREHPRPFLYLRQSTSRARVRALHRLHVAALSLASLHPVFPLGSVAGAQPVQSHPCR